MQYQIIKVEAVMGTEEEPLLYSVTSDSPNAEEAVEALKSVDWSKVFPNMCPYDIGEVTLSASYMDNRK